jgi:arginine-tRNA-protein transferase
MSRPIISPLQPFFRTGDHPCPYIEGMSERKIVTELTANLGPAIYNELSRAGFRRSHAIAYRPACPGCSACLPVRIVVKPPAGSAKRVLKTNQDLAVSFVKPVATVEQYRLFVRYQHIRHAGGDMAAMSFGDFRAMIEDSPLDTVLMLARDGGGRLLGVCLADLLDDGCSAVYSFFEPDAPERSLGTWIVLQLVERMRATGKPYVYLGYWIENSRKMAYKRRFKPLEALGTRGWNPI